MVQKFTETFHLFRTADIVVEACHEYLTMEEYISSFIFFEDI